MSVAFDFETILKSETEILEDFEEFKENIIHRLTDLDIQMCQSINDAIKTSHSVSKIIAATSDSREILRKELIEKRKATYNKLLALEHHITPLSTMSSMMDTSLLYFVKIEVCKRFSIWADMASKR